MVFGGILRPAGSFDWICLDSVEGYSMHILCGCGYTVCTESPNFELKIRSDLIDSDMNLRLVST